MPTDPNIQAIECTASSNVGWARYNFATHVLEIDFKNKLGTKISTYAYDGYPVEEWDRFRSHPAKGKGKFFAFEIRPKFVGRKIWPTLEADKPSPGVLLI